MSRRKISVAFVVGTFFVFALDLVWTPNKQPTPPAYSFTAATEALSLMREWASWMAAIQTATLAAIGVLLEKRALTSHERNPAFCTVLFVGAALLSAAWLLACLPSVALRLTDSGLSPLNDIYEQRVFPGTPVRLGLLTTLFHLYWLLGVLSFGLLLLRRYP